MPHWPPGRRLFGRQGPCRQGGRPTPAPLAEIAPGGGLHPRRGPRHVADGLRRPIGACLGPTATRHRRRGFQPRSRRIRPRRTMVSTGFAMTACPRPMIDEPGRDPGCETKLPAPRAAGPGVSQAGGAEAVEARGAEPGCFLRRNRDKMYADCRTQSGALRMVGRAMPHDPGTARFVEHAGQSVQRFSEQAVRARPHQAENHLFWRHLRCRWARAQSCHIAPRHQRRMPFWTWRRFSASSNTTDCGPSKTSDVTSSSRWAGRQCMNRAWGLAAAIRRRLT